MACSTIFFFKGKFGANYRPLSSLLAQSMETSGKYIALKEIDEELFFSVCIGKLVQKKKQDILLSYWFLQLDNNNCN